jgi:putative MATE family efflux protein
MKDLTQGPIGRHVLEMSIPIMVGMLLQTLYFLIDLYFVSRLGEAAIAGVSSAGNLFFIVMALTQMLGVGTVALMSHAVGRKDREEANHIFNQSVVLALLCTLVTLLGGYAFASDYMWIFAPDEATHAAGVAFLHGYLPGMGLQFALVVMGSALRGTGIVKPTMVVQMLTVLLNAALAPVMIAGWGTGIPLGPAGAGWASTIAIAVGTVVLAIYFVKLESYVEFDTAQWHPKLATWKRMLNVGLPSGGEFLMLGVYSGVIYWIIRHFGAAAQAGFGIGSRVMQAIFLPAMAIAFAVPAIAGQNFGARKADRVRETFRRAVITSIVIMFTLSLFVQWKGEAMVSAFTSDPAVANFGFGFLKVISWNFVAVGIVFTCSGMFQGLGNTWPSLISTATRMLTFAIPGIWMSGRPGFEIQDLWHLSVATMLLQAALSYFLLRMQFEKRLGPMAAVAAPQATG